MIIIYSLVIFFYTILMIKVKVGFRNTIDNIENIEIFVAFNEGLTEWNKLLFHFFFFLIIHKYFINRQQLELSLYNINFLNDQKYRTRCLYMYKILQRKESEKY